MLFNFFRMSRRILFSKSISCFVFPLIKFIFSAFAFLAFISLPSKVSATHLVGGSITYKYLGIYSGYYRFQVTVDMFRDAIPPSTQPTPTPFDQQIDIAVYERTRNSAGDTLLLTTLTVDITTPENRVQPPKASIHCKTPPPVVDIREGIYIGILNLKPSMYGYYLVHRRCCRNSMLNVKDSMGQTYFAIIPPTNIFNSTPVFNAVPAPYICANDTISLLYTASDPDGDSLTYSLGWPYQGGDAFNPIPGAATKFDSSIIKGVDYYPGYSPVRPLGASGYAKIDKITGVLKIYAPSVGRYAIAVDVMEYRKGVYISTTRRDVQIIAMLCDPQAAPKRIPVSDSIPIDSSTTTTYIVEAGYRLAFNLKYVTDQSNVTAFKYSGFVTNPGNVTNKPQFSYTLNNQYVTAYFNWQTTCRDAGSMPYTFTVSVYDTGCAPKITYEGIKIFVVPFQGANHITGPDPACQGNQGYLYTTSRQKKEYKLTWIVTGGTFTKGPNDSSIRVVWGTGPTGTIKLVGYNSITGCRSDTVIKTIKINPKPRPFLVVGPLSSCVGNANAYSIPNNSSINYNWSVGGGVITKSDVNNKNVQILWNKADTNVIKVVGVDSNGCRSDTAVIKAIVEKPIADSIFGSYSVCPNASGIDYWVKSQAGSTYYWKISGGIQTAGGNTAHIKIDWGEKGGGEVEVLEKTLHGCPGDTLRLIVTKDYVLYTSPIRGDTSLCEFRHSVPYEVTFSNGSVYDWKISGGTIIAGSGTASILVDWDKAGKGALSVQETAFDPINKKPCVGIPVSLIVDIHPIPNTSEIIGPSGICEKDIIVYSVHGLPGSTYTWKFHGKTNISKADTARWQEMGLTGLTDTFHIEVTEMSKDSCQGPTRYLTVTAHKVPVTSQITGPPLICFPDLKGAVYSVTGFPNSDYEWVVDGGAIVSGDKTNKITVDWYVEGNRSVHLQEISDFGCKGPQRDLKVRVDSLALNLDLVTTSLNNDKEIEVYWTKKNDEFFDGYFRIYRSTMGQEFFRLIDSVPKGQTYYVDKNVKTSLYAYRYRIQAVNSCGTPIKTTVHRSILLSGNFDGDTTIHLNWNPYEGWPVDEYKINNLRDPDTTLTVYNFTKDTSFVVIKTLEGYRWCMRIAAYKAGSGLKNVISWSNKICFDFDPLVWIPNAFTPSNGDNINNTFHVFAGNYKSFQLDIYNRWGEHIFTSDNPDKQWDGTFKGNICVEGVYLYIVSVGGQKSNIYRNGTLHLLR
jgi:gliding motility-associated-like protein